jgi:hypothetical protein
MLIEEPIRPLGQVDCVALTQRVLALDEAEWFRDPRRQNDYDVHASTQSLILVFCEGWPQIRIAHASGWQLLSDVAMPVVHDVIARFYQQGGVILRAMMARLPAGCRIARHKDVHPSFAAAHRIHIPLLTNPDVEFTVGNLRVPPREHFAFELNNNMFHEVANNGARARIHFIFDYALKPRSPGAANSP